MTPPIRVPHILGEVADTWSLDLADLTGRSRKAEHVWPRQLAMFLIRFATKLSLSQIGQRFDGRDHTTVASAIAKIERELSSDVWFQPAILALAARIRARADREAVRNALFGELSHG